VRTGRTSIRLLIVDDDPLVLDLLSNSLRIEDGYEITCSQSAEHAIALIDDADLAFDCLLLDIMLPGSTGIDLCREVRRRARYRMTPVLIMTGSNQANLMEQAYGAGATDFIAKPFEGVELGARIRTAALLGESLERERMARHERDELLSYLNTDYENAGRLEGDDLIHPAIIENMLLRLPQGCHFIRLFVVEFTNRTELCEAIAPGEVRRCLKYIARSTIETLQPSPAKLAYAGCSRFIGAHFGRRAIDFRLFGERINSRLVETWRQKKAGPQNPPKILLSPLSDRRIWSGLSAGNSFRDYLQDSRDTELSLPSLESAVATQSKTATTVVPQDEADLFARLEIALNTEMTGDAIEVAAGGNNPVQI